MLQVDKGFNIVDDCAARRMYVQLPPGLRGQAQMSVAANIKMSRVANLRILVDQVIRRLKSFQIIKNTVPVTLIFSLDKILIVCAALSNLKEPIYRDACDIFMFVSIQAKVLNIASKITLIANY